MGDAAGDGGGDRLFVNFVPLISLFRQRKEIILLLFLGAPISCAFFIEFHISTNNDFSNARIIELIALRAWIMANEHILFPFIIQLGSLLIQYMCICNAPKHMKMGNCRLLPTPSLLWGFFLYTSCGATIGQIDCTIYSFSPKFFRHFLAFLHAFGHIKN